jgi:hypothetical protein
MLLKKEILLFYTLIVVSAGVIIAADRSPEKISIEKKPCPKCCKAPKSKKADQTTPPLYYITEGIFRFKA